jgi:hypothetical protein
VSNAIEHSTGPMLIDGDHLQRGEVFLEKDAQGTVIMMWYDGQELRKARNDEQLLKSAQEYLANCGPSCYTCSIELAIRALVDVRQA